MNYFPTRRARAALFTLAAGALVAACAGDLSLGDPSSSDAQTISNKDGGAADAACPPNAHCLPDGGGGGSDGGSALDGGSSGGGGACGQTRGMSAPLNCASDEYCDYGFGYCGGDDTLGTCTKRPTTCASATPQRLCGCDGQFYASACGAEAAGTDVSNSTGCLPQGSFACGGSTCTDGAQYCLETSPGIPQVDGGGSNSYACDGLPAACALDPTCACVRANSPACPGMEISCSDTGGRVTRYCGGI